MTELPKQIVFDVPDEDGVFFMDNRGEAEYDMNALIRWLKDNNMSAEPGQELSQEIADQFIAGDKA